MLLAFSIMLENFQFSTYLYIWLFRVWGMVKRVNQAFFSNKKSLKLAETIVWIIVALIGLFIFGWAILNAANRIFG